MPYVIAYIGVGIFISIVALARGWPKISRPLASFAFIAALWPILLIASPEMLLEESSTRKKDLPDKADPLSEAIATALKDGALSLSPRLLSSLRTSAKRGEISVTYFADRNYSEEILNSFWDAEIPPAAYYPVQQARNALRDSGIKGPAGRATASIKEPDWRIGFSNEFLRCISKVDAKLRRRILDAVGKISRQPTGALGDTVKPLKSDLSGMWRYRIGDYRLIYLPDTSTKRVTLLFFAAIGDVYSGA